MVNASEYICEFVIITQIIYIEIISQFITELFCPCLLFFFIQSFGCGIGAFYPFDKSFKIFRLFCTCFILGIDVIIIWKTCLKHFQPVWDTIFTLGVEIIIKKHSHRVVIIQKLPTFGRIITFKFFCYPRLVMIAWYIQKAEYIFCTLVIIPIEFSQKLRSFLYRATIKEQARLTIYRSAYIILVLFPVYIFLRRNKFSNPQQGILDNTSHASIMRT